MAQFRSPSSQHSLTKSKSFQNLKYIARDVMTDPRKGGAAPPPIPKPSEKESEGKSKQPIIYCTAISRYCFKVQRRTLPPWFVIATNGHGRFASTRDNFDRAEKLRVRYLAVAREKLNSRSGSSGRRSLARDGFLQGSGNSAHGIASKFHEAADRGDDWTQPEYWQLGEFEETRLQGLEGLQGTAGRFDL